MHSQNVLHRDIRSMNVFFSDDGEIKICALGFSTFLSEQNEYRQTKAAVTFSASPEIIQGIQYSKEVDVWSFGCFAYELATGKVPFSTIKDDNELIQNIINTEVPEIPADRWSPAFIEFVKACL